MSDAAPLPDTGVTPLWRRVLPFVVGGALLAYVFSRIDVRALVNVLAKTNYAGFFAFTAAFALALLAADTWATVEVYRRTIGEVRYRDLFVIRAASYVPSLVNHHVGQAWLTYFLSRVYGAALWKVAGATLLVYATTFGALFFFLLMGFIFGASPPTWLASTVAVISLAGLAYLVVVRLRLGILSRWQITEPLVRVGVRGHLVLLLYRLPHVAVQFFGAWVPFFFFDVKIPLSDALALMPVFMFVVALPVSPQGLGTRDALALALLQPYALGDADQRTAAIAATTLSWLGALTLVQLVMSPFFMRRAYRLLARSREARGSTGSLSNAS